MRKNLAHIIIAALLLQSGIVSTDDSTKPGGSKEWQNLRKGGNRWGLVAGWDNNSGAGYVYRLGFYPWPFIRGSFFRTLDANSVTVNNTGLFSLALGIVKIVEFNASISVNQSTSHVDFSGRTLNWSPIVFSNVTSVGVDGSVVTFRRAFTSFSAPVVYPNFYANLTIDYYPRDVTVLSDDGKTRITSGGSQIKYSFGFGNFSYQYTNSSLALVHAVWSSKFRMLRGSPTNRRAYLGIDNGGYFAWLGSVRAAPGVTLSIQTLSLQNSTDYGVSDGTDASNSEDDGSNASGRRLIPSGRGGNNSSSSGDGNAAGDREAEGDMSRGVGETADAVIFVVGLNNTKPDWFYWDPTVGLQDPSASAQLDPSNIYVDANTTPIKTSGAQPMISSPILLPLALALALFLGTF
ncbi:hypothetical protein BJ742DRAFT_741859 [Cladochytrium replicatum]|nr:hypothetical protein BJ742DRAFT_741859 [Cladochytrium replicatum]